MSMQGVKYIKFCIVCERSFFPTNKVYQVTCGRECRAIKERIQRYYNRVRMRNERLKKENSRGKQRK